MSLTKEECEKALDNITLEVSTMDNEDTRLIESNVDEEINLLDDLIKEHFELLDVLKDCGWGELTPEGLRVVIEASQYNAKKLNELRSNPPLKFEELKENMWVWDNKRKMFIKIFDTATLEENFFSFEVFGWEVPIYDEQFEENRFYKREVK